jgi:hypothetical protein
MAMDAQARRGGDRVAHDGLGEVGPVLALQVCRERRL